MDGPFPTEVIVVDPAAPDAAAIARAAECLRAGGLVAFPTETVYGLGAHALDPAAVQRVFAAKGRPATDPLIVHIASLTQLRALAADVPDVLARLAERFWPGPLTVILRRSSVVPDAVTAGLNGVALRIPSHPIAHALLVAAGLPIAAPSANQFSRPSPTRALHVQHDLGGRIDLILDGGSTTVGVESTVLDLTGTCPTILRPGAVTLEMLREVVEDVSIRDASDAPTVGPMVSPGLLSQHYSPRTPLTLYDGDAAAALARMQKDAAALTASGRRVIVVDFGADADAATTAGRLYAALRDADAADAELILVRGSAVLEGLGLAIRDRLKRAAAGRIIQA